MNHRKHKQQKNLNKPKKEVYKSFANDPEGAVCPYCGQKKKSCSNVDSLARAYARAACKKQNEK